MPDDPSKRAADDTTPASAEGLRYGGRRRVPRYPFLAAVEVTELSSGARLRARMSDLGVQGCYVQTLNPFPVGALVLLRLVNRKESLKTTGQVCHSQPTLGMGLAFTDLKFDQLVMLEDWLVALGSKRGPGSYV